VSQELVKAHRFSRKGGYLAVRTADNVLWVDAHGYIGPSLLRDDLAFATRFDAMHEGGWTYVVDIRRVRWANPLNIFYLRKITRLPNLRGYIVVSRSRFVRFLLRLGRWLVRNEAVGSSRDALKLAGKKTREGHKAAAPPP
jgi:hypothetical protein